MKLLLIPDLSLCPPANPRPQTGRPPGRLYPDIAVMTPAGYLGFSVDSGGGPRAEFPPSLSPRLAERPPARCGSGHVAVPARVGSGRVGSQCRRESGRVGSGRSAGASDVVRSSSSLPRTRERCSARSVFGISGEATLTRCPRGEGTVSWVFTVHCALCSVWVRQL